MGVVYQEESANNKCPEHLGKAHGKRTSVPGRHGVRLVWGRDLARLRASPGLGQEVFT